MESNITKKEYLESKYRQFSKELTNELGINIFPSLDEVSMIDILLFFQFTFSSLTDYEEPVRTLMSHYIDIDEDKFNDIYPTIKLYIDDLKDFLKNN
jgi:hypothetical protein